MNLDAKFGNRAPWRALGSVSTSLKSRLADSDLRERVIRRGRLIIESDDPGTPTSSCIALHRPLVVATDRKDDGF